MPCRGGFGLLVLFAVDTLVEEFNCTPFLVFVSFDNVDCCTTFVGSVGRRRLGEACVC